MGTVVAGSLEKPVQPMDVMPAECLEIQYAAVQLKRVLGHFMAVPGLGGKNIVSLNAPTGRWRERVG